MFKTQFASEGYDAFVSVPGDVLTNPKGLHIYSSKNIGLSLKESVERLIQNKVRQELMYKAGISAKVYEDTQVDVDSETITISETGDETNSSSAGAMILAGVMGLILYVTLLLYGSQVMNGVIEEKSNRIIEVIISSVKPYQLMLGKIIGVGTYGYNFVNMTKLTWMMNCYLCYRGGINWTFDVADSDGPLQNLKVYKDNTGSLSARVSSSAITVDTDSKRNAIVYSCQNSGAAGSALCDQRTNVGLDVLCPNMSRYKFQTTSLNTGNVASTSDGSDLDAFILQGYYPFPSSSTTSPVIIHTYNATGVDFGLYFYINAPTLYYYSAKPAAS